MVAGVIEFNFICNMHCRRFPSCCVCRRFDISTHSHTSQCPTIIGTWLYYSCVESAVAVYNGWPDPQSKRSCHRRIPDVQCSDELVGCYVVLSIILSELWVRKKAISQYNWATDNLNSAIDSRQHQQHRHQYHHHRCRRSSQRRQDDAVSCCHILAHRCR